jgi:hypothetical protein
MTPKKRPTKTGRSGGRKEYGDDFLRDVEAVVVRLESGKRAKFSVEKEVGLPTDEESLREAARRLPAQYAFWAYQTERALQAVRRLERELQSNEGDKYFGWRLRLHKDEVVDLPIERVTDKVLQAAVALDEELKGQRDTLDEARYQYGVLRAIRDAVEQKRFVIPLLLNRSKALG